MITTLLILAGASALFVHGKIRADLVGMSALILLLLFGILTPQEALSGFSNTITMMLVSVFIVGGAVARTGLAKRVSGKILTLAGANRNVLFVMVVLVTAAIGAFVSNTGTVAIMMPIVISLAAGAGASASRLLMPLAFASTMGGMLTLIGTTPNMIISGALEDAGYPALHFFSFLPIGLICISAGTAFLLFASKLLVKEDDEAGQTDKNVRSLTQLADEYQIKQEEHLARVLPGSSLAGKPLRDIDAFRQYGVTIVDIRRRRARPRLFESPVEQIMPESGTEMREHDLFSFLIPEENLAAFVEACAVELTGNSDPRPTPGKRYTFEGYGIAELVILSASRLVDRKVRDAGLRENYGLRVLGLRRKNAAILQHIGNMKIQAGDALLVQGKWKNIARLAEEQAEWVVVGKPEEAQGNETLDHKAPLAAIVIVLMIAAMVTNLLAPITAVMLAALVLIFTGCFRNVEEAYKTISWQSVVLVASMLPAAIALEKTGAAALASHGLIQAFGGYGPYALLAAIYGATSIVTLFVSNTAAGALCTPVAMQAALNMGLSPYPFLFAVATAASMSLAFPFSTPPNVLVMAPGRYSFMDYVKVGGPLQLLFGVIMIFVLPLIWPFEG